MTICNSIMQPVEKFTDAYHLFCSCEPGQNPWKKAPGYVLNPFVNLGLTVIHIAKTVERTLKACYYLGTSILTSLAVIFTAGRIKKINHKCVQQWIGLGLNLYSAFISLGLTFANIGALAQGFLDSQKAAKNEAWLIKQQNELDREIPEAQDLFYNHICVMSN